MCLFKDSIFSCAKLRAIYSRVKFTRGEMRFVSNRQPNLMQVSKQKSLVRK